MHEEHKKSMEIIGNWYESYYYWNNAIFAQTFLNGVASNPIRASNNFTPLQQPIRTAHRQHNQTQPIQRPIPRSATFVVNAAPVYKVPSLSRRFLGKFFFYK
jgi:hypothetical protein